MLRAVTAPLAGAIVAFQAPVIVCPLGSVKASVQPLTAAAELFLIVTEAVNPVFQAFMSYVTEQAPGGAGDVDVGTTDGDVEVATPPSAVRVELYAAFLA